MGFTTYEIAPVVTQTLKERLDELTGAQKVAVLDGFVMDTPVLDMKRDQNIPSELVKALYNAIELIEVQSKILMREEIIITPAELDPETGEVITPAVMNTAPADAIDLAGVIAVGMTDSFSLGEVQFIVNRMMNEANLAGDATWDYYAQEVIK